MNYEEEINNLKKRISLLENIILSNAKLAENKEINKKSKRDKTKYLFDKKILSKNRLVLNVIRNYTKTYNPTFYELQQTFDKSLQGTRNVVEEISNAKKISDCNKRYFMAQDEIIKLRDGKMVVVCSQWGVFNINNFIKIATKLGFDIQSV